ncbi:MAG TPA: hypothetical protein VMQ44_03175, partial [Candidatus Saccharimonadales bacterium]|nr:hypothetical protein [Candidatus Saccharimonadales bacterium]
TPWRTRVSLLTTRDFQSFDYRGVILKNQESKDAVLFPRQIQGQYFLLHRMVPDIYLARSKNPGSFEGGMRLLGPTEKGWENLKVGAACPPLEVEPGWLLLYHGVSKGKTYSVGAALLDKNNPAFVIKRTQEPILTPETGWEKKGAVSNVIFPTGLLTHGDELWLYYGAADYRIGLVKLRLNDLINTLT